MPKGYPADGKKRKLSPATRCAVCKHPERPRIEALHCAGASLDKLSEKFGLHRDSIWRHMLRHVSDDRKAGYLIGAGKIAKLAEVAAEESESLIDYYSILRSALFYQLDRLAAKDDHAGVVAIAARLTDVLKEIGRVTGQVSTIASSTIINVQNNYAILNSQPFAELQSGLVEICAAHPEARADILALFRRLDEKYSSAPMPPRMIEARGAAHA